MALEIGQQLEGWSVVQALGPGDLGEQYRVERAGATGAAEPGVLTLLTLPSLRDALARSEIEATRVEHPGVVKVLDTQFDAQPAFFVTELVAGRSLSRVLTDRKRLSTNDSVSVIRPVLAALSAGHEKKLLHADVRPSNIILAAGGRVLLGDFGIGRAVSMALDQARKTGAGDNLEVRRLAEALRYMAPEVLAGDIPSFRSDIYSVGIVLHEMLSGDSRRLRFPIPWVGVHVSDAAEKATRADPGERFASAEEFLDALVPPAGGVVLTNTSSGQNDAHTALQRRGGQSGIGGAAGVAASGVNLTAGSKSGVSAELDPAVVASLSGVRSLPQAVPPAATASAAESGVNYLEIDPFKLYLLADPNHPAKPLRKEVTVFGSRPGVSVRLLDPEILDTHCAITKLAAGYVLSDLGSDIGTKVNGKTVKAVMLKDGDLIQVGEHRFRFGK